MSLVKLPFLLSGFVAAYTLQTPPQARVPAHKREKDVGLLEWFVSASASFNVAVIKGFTSIPPLIEAAVILASRFQSYPLSQWILRVFTRNHPGLVRKLVLSPTFLAACAVGAVAGVLRYQCYRTLGRFFTYELAIHNGHRLVTEGLYRYVRHPSYTAWIAGTVGVGLMSLTPGSWVRECDLLDTQGGKVALVAGILWVVYGAVGLMVRTSTEDRMMKKEFGDEWEVYAQRVTYRMIPCVF
ncbi:hypothetical protein DAEQUDRAFT_678690 [Daedalea quercina L-15889]|uniref:Protein-S-isoprenylcysteine O-methyltransferase n=1 Tax=Daedalea quercina L-15889 TaxID=1314783 RepID=A0A165LG57_9APHY|nr:hypothetical protein DAEQUDRAFT_678690 [Daedalea quercina L-15889]